MELEKAIELKSKLMKLDIQKFSNWINTFSPYWENSGGGSPSEVDARAYFEFLYEQDPTTGETTYTMGAYAQFYSSGYDVNETIPYNVTCVIAGEYFNRTGTYWWDGTPGWKLYKLFEVQKIVAPNSDGTGKTISYTGYGKVLTNNKFSLTYSYTPPTVQVAAKLGTVNNFTIGTNFTVPATLYSSSFTHTLNIKIGTTTVATRTITSANTTITFSSSELTTIYNNSKTTNTPTFTFELITKNGTTQVGSTSTTTAIGTLTGVTPTIDLITTSINGHLNNTYSIISGVSSVMIQPNYTLQKNANIKQVVINGITISNPTNTYAVYTFANCTTGTFKVEITDSRGNKATATKTVTLIPYIPVTAKATFTRQSSTSGTVNLSYEGNYYSGSLGDVNNSLTLKWKYKLRTSSTWTNGGTITPTISGTKYSGSIKCGDNFAYTSDYDFALEYADKINTNGIITQPVNKGLGILELYKTAALVNGDLKVSGNETISGSLTVGNTNIINAINGKQASITGGASTITGSNLTANRVLISNGSGKVAVDATTTTQLGYMKNKVAYSTNETAVGTWVDGKVLYRKVIKKTDKTSVSLSSLNYDYMIIKEATINVLNYIRDPYYTSSSDFFRVLINNSKNLVIEYPDGWNGSVNYIYIILEYTKK